MNPTDTATAAEQGNLAAATIALPPVESTITALAYLIDLYAADLALGHRHAAERARPRAKAQR